MVMKKIVAATKVWVEGKDGSRGAPDSGGRVCTTQTFSKKK